MSRPGRSVVLDAGPYPVTNTGIGGIGLRLAELAHALTGWFDVTVLLADQHDHVLPDGIRVLPQSAWPTALADAAAVMFFDLADRERLEQAAAAGRVIITENAPPIEHLEYPSLNAPDAPANAHQGIVDDYRRQLEISDHFLCRSAIERTTLTANLSVTGRLTPADVRRSRTLQHLITLVPIGFSDSAVTAADRAVATPLADFLWTGGIWAYYRPGALLEAMALLRDRGVACTAAFLYGRPHPDNLSLLDGLRDRIDRLGLADAVTICDDPPAHDSRDAALKAARGLVVLAAPGIENDTCVRLRIRDSRLYGLPTVCDPHGATAGELVRDGLGHIVDPDDVPALADTLAGLLDRTAPATDAVRRGYTYQTTVAAFATWLAATIAERRGWSGQ